MPDLRKPTDRAAAWETWRRRINGESVAIGDVPEPGWYKAKRQGQWTAIQIDLHQVIDDEGNLAEEERVMAFIGVDVVTYDAAKVGEVWLRCAANPITEAEAERLLKMPAVNDLSRSVIV